MSNMQGNFYVWSMVFIGLLGWAWYLLRDETRRVNKRKKRVAVIQRKGGVRVPHKNYRR